MSIRLDTDKAILEIALDLSVSMPAKALYQRLIQSVARVFPCDAAALLVYNGNELVPAALHGLAPELLGQRFKPEHHPRLQVIMASRLPIRFPDDSQLPDPFDGRLALDTERELDVHACLGCSLYAEDNLVGVLTLDALEVGVFEEISDEQIATFSALAGAALRNVALVEQLRQAQAQQQAIAQELVQEARRREGEIIGNSAVIEKLREEIRMVAGSDLSVLITGDTGTGKELVARTLHMESRRVSAPLVHVNCAALPESVAESELFGHVKGAFTGADGDRMGKFELADGGTLFLDEVGELPLGLQAKLLRALQQGEIQRVGADRNLQVNVRVIAATNRDLADEVARGRFRSDLYHRLRVFPLVVPPLREHKEDLPVLAGYFLEQAQHKLGMELVALHPSALQAIMQYDWPGNVRELEHLLLRASLKARQPGLGKVRIDVDHLDLGDGATAPLENRSSQKADTPAASSAVPEAGLTKAVEAFKRQLIQQALDEHQHNWSQTAKALKMDRGNFYRLAQRLGLKS
ncbi:nitric oxide reductase transcriptional regulator NorR [Corallincola platygyrae]|uniref:Nitric oxide reductase transcriptional regulator NorR n=1 Tax=Corallincola platygyrae TaxID=1193278 RepID=A0ABW4XPY9_9GAMM